MRLLCWREAERGINWLPTQEPSPGYSFGKRVKLGGRLEVKGKMTQEEIVAHKEAGRGQRLQPLSGWFQMGC
jgi:hypothetical protein